MSHIAAFQAEALRYYTRTESLEGYACDVCGSKRPAQKRIRVRRFPYVLLIQLNRARTNVSGYGGVGYSASTYFNNWFGTTNKDAHCDE